MKKEEKGELPLKLDSKEYYAMKRKHKKGKKKERIRLGKRKIAKRADN